jgi:hypothetical protein
MKKSDEGKAAINQLKRAVIYQKAKLREQGKVQEEKELNETIDMLSKLGNWEENKEDSSG